MRSTYLTISCVFLFVHATVRIVSATAGPANEERLISSLLSTNQKFVRPARNVNETVNVTFGISLQQIIDLDPKTEALRTLVWPDYEWKDLRLAWNESSFGGIQSIRVPSSDIWTPDIMLYNSAAKSEIVSNFPVTIVVDSNGICIWIPPGILSSACQVELTWFPYDSQTCKLKFGSWTNDVGKLNLTLRSNAIDLATYTMNSEWDLIEAPAARHAVKYACCPEEYVDITYTVKLQRRASYHSFNVIAPWILLSLLTLVIFILPPGAAEKIGLGITILLIETVLQTLLSGKILTTQASIPLLHVYMFTLMVMTTLSVILSAFVLNAHRRSQEISSEPPSWLTTAVEKVLAPLMRMERPSGKSDQESAEHTEIAKSKEDTEQGGDWKFTAAVIDRLCLCIFSIFLVIATLAIFIRLAVVARH